MLLPSVVKLTQVEQGVFQTRSRPLRSLFPQRAVHDGPVIVVPGDLLRAARAAVDHFAHRCGVASASSGASSRASARAASSGGRRARRWERSHEAAAVCHADAFLQVARRGRRGRGRRLSVVSVRSRGASAGARVNVEGEPAGPTGSPRPLTRPCRSGCRAVAGAARSIGRPSPARSTTISRDLPRRPWAAPRRPIAS